MNNPENRLNMSYQSKKKTIFHRFFFDFDRRIFIILQLCF